MTTTARDLALIDSDWATYERHGDVEWLSFTIPVGGYHTHLRAMGWHKTPTVAGYHSSYTRYPDCDETCEHAS